MADSQGDVLRAAWSPLQLQIWLQLASDALIQIWIEVATLAAHNGTPIPMRNRAAAFEQLRASWTTIVPREHPSPESTDWGRWPSAAGRPAWERAEIWDKIAAKCELPRWRTDITLLLYGRKSPYTPGRKKNQLSIPGGTRERLLVGGPSNSRKRKDNWTLPVPNEGDYQQIYEPQRTTIRASQPVLKRASGEIPEFPIVGTEDDKPAGAAAVEGHPERYRVADMPTVEIPLDWSLHALPGSAPLALFEPILASAEHFADLDITRQALALMMIACPSLYLHPRLVGAIRLYRSVPALTGALDGTFLLDLERGILHCPIEDALVRALAQNPGNGVPGDVTGLNTYWPLVLPQVLVGWWRLHVHRVADHGIRIEDGQAALYLQPTPGASPRPLTGGDINVYFDSRSTIGQRLSGSDLLVFAEMLTYRVNSPICPGILCHVSGTYHHRYGAVVPYQRPRHATRRDAAQSLCSTIVSELVSRFVHAPSPLDSTAAMGPRLLSWVTEGQEAGKTALTNLDLNARSGSPTVPDLSAIARSWDAALDMLNSIDTIDSEGMRQATTTIAEIFSGLRWDELRYCNWSDIHADVEEKVWLRVARKAAGDANRRWMHIAVVGMLADLLTAARARQRTGSSQAHRPFDDSAAVERANGSRHAISTFIVDHYAELGWGPGDWIIAQGQLGHEIDGFPTMRDDGASFSMLHHVWTTLIDRFVQALDEELQDAK